MKTIDQKGFGIPGLVVVLVVIAVLGGIGAVVWQKQTAQAPATVTNASDSLQTKPVQPDSALALSISELPQGWSRDEASLSAGRVLLRSTSPDCSVGFTHTNNTAESNSPDIDHHQQALQTIRSKGYTVEELPASKITITTPTGTQQLDVHNLRLTGNDNPMFQKYAYVSTEASYTQIQLSCRNEADMPAAEKALLAIRADIE